MFDPKSPASHILPMQPLFSEKVLKSMIAYGINLYNSTTENTHVYIRTLTSVTLFEKLSAILWISILETEVELKVRPTCNCHGHINF